MSRYLFENIGGSEPRASLLPFSPGPSLAPLDLQDYIDIKNKLGIIHRIEVQKANGQIADNALYSYKLYTVDANKFEFFVPRLRYFNRAVTTLIEQSQF